MRWLTIAQGDHRVLVAARTQARNQFNDDRVLLSGGPEAEARILHAQEVATFLKANVVQGEKTGEDEQQYSTIVGHSQD